MGHSGKRIGYGAISLALVKSGSADFMSVLGLWSRLGLGIG